jgi:hypothetical protein
MSDVSILRIHIVTVWLFLGASLFIVLVHVTVMVIPPWRRHARPRAVCHIAVLASLYIIAVYSVIVSKPKFQRLYRVFHTHTPNQAMPLTAGRRTTSLSMTKTRLFQAKPLSPAVADLVTRPALVLHIETRL